MLEYNTIQYVLFLDSSGNSPCYSTLRSNCSLRRKQKRDEAIFVCDTFLSIC